MFTSLCIEVGIMGRFIVTIIWFLFAEREDETILGNVPVLLSRLNRMQYILHWE